MRRFKSDNFLEEKRARKSLYNDPAEQGEESNLKEIQSSTKAAIIHVVHAVTKKQPSLEKRHYYFKLEKEKLVDSEAKFKAGAS